MPPGPDAIPCRLLKELATELAPVLTSVFRQSLESGTLPTIWTKAFVTPVFKNGNRNEAENYRPVSLTCVTCKIFEHVICKHIRNHLDHYEILTTLNHGFRAGHSCESQLLVTIHDLMRYRDRKVQVDLAILDFSKAFDTVPHNRLLQKLEFYGIQGDILKWISVFSNLEISVWWLGDRGQAQYPWTLEFPRVLCSALSCSSCILMTCPLLFRRKLDSSLTTVSCIVPLKREATRRTFSPTWMLSNSGAMHEACVSTRRSAILCASAGVLDPSPSFILFVTLFSLRWTVLNI